MNTLKAYKKNKKIDYSDEKQLWDAYLISETKELHEKITKDLLEKEEISEEEFAAYFA